MSAFQEGYNAAKSGNKSITDNPYQIGSTESEQWLMGIISYLLIKVRELEAAMLK